MLAGTVRADGRLADRLAAFRRRGLGGGARLVRRGAGGGAGRSRGARRARAVAVVARRARRRDRQQARGLCRVPPPRRCPRGGAASRSTSPASTASTACRSAAAGLARAGAPAARQGGDRSRARLAAIEEAKRAGDPAVAEALAREALALAQQLAGSRRRVHGARAAGPRGRAAGQGRGGRGAARRGDDGRAGRRDERSRSPAATRAARRSSVCDGLADLQRAAEWCEAVVEFAERRRFTPLQSWCRAIFGAVLVRSGEWERAERVLDAGARAPA